MRYTTEILGFSALRMDLSYLRMMHLPQVLSMNLQDVLLTTELHTALLPSKRSFHSKGNAAVDPYSWNSLVFSCSLASSQRTYFGDNFLSIFILINNLCVRWRRKWQPTPVFLPGESHGQRSWWATTHGVNKESDTTEWLSKHMYM